MEDNNPMQALFEMYDAQVAEHDKAGYAQKFKDCTDLFFKDVGEHWHFEEAPIHFTDVEYLDGYFLFGMGTNSVIHFHVAECPGWKFAIWWETPEDKDDDDIITGQFFTQYEETIDKFKPSRSDMCIKIVMRLDVDEPYCEDYVDAANIINFIKNEPALAFCRDYWGWDYNAEYHTREEAQIEYDKYKAWLANKLKYTKILDDKVVAFVKDRVIPRFNGAFLRHYDELSPEYDLAAPLQENTDIVDEPGSYGWNGDDEESQQIEAEYRALIEECTKVSHEYKFCWFSPVCESIYFFDDKGNNAKE